MDSKKISPLHSRHIVQSLRKKWQVKFQNTLPIKKKCKNSKQKKDSFKPAFSLLILSHALQIFFLYSSMKNCQISKTYKSTNSTKNQTYLALFIKRNYKFEARICSKTSDKYVPHV